MNKKYTCYETNETFTKSQWYKWYEQYGDHSNFADVDCWFEEMIRMSILSK